MGDLPEEFGQWNSIFRRFRRWCEQGVFDIILLKEGFGRSRGGFTSKIHARADRRGRPIALLITGGEASDSKWLQPLMEIPIDTPPPKRLLADAGCDSDDNRATLLSHGTLPAIKANPTRKIMPSLDRDA